MNEVSTTTVDFTREVERYRHELRVHCYLLGSSDEDEANRQPAVANYVKRPGADVYEPVALDVLRVEDGEITEVLTFPSGVFGRFGLPATLCSTRPATGGAGGRVARREAAITVSPVLRIEIDGVAPSAEQVAAGLLGNYGHFTAMQVRDRRVQGLDLHLRRLDVQHRELYGTGLDGDHVRRLVSHALGDDVRDAAVRVVASGPATPSTMVVVRPPMPRPDRPQRLLSVDYQRPLPHVKHIGGFGQRLHQKRAVDAGYDDALLTTRDGVVVEGAVANIAFLDDDGGIVWTRADWLHGTAMQLLERELPSRRAVVRREDLRSFRGAFLCNSIGVAAVSAIDDVEYTVDTDAMARVRAALDSVVWDEID